MTARTSIATVCLSGTLPDKLAATAHAGFDGVELFEPDLLGSPLSPSQVRDLCTELDLSIDLYQPFRNVEGAGDERFQTNLRRAHRVFGTMEELGCDLVLICSSVAEDTIDDDELAASQLRQLAEVAAGYGIRIAYEALAWGITVNTWEHSWRIVQLADHPNLGVCLDSFHVLSKTTQTTDIDQIPAEKLFFLQLADAPHLDMDVLQWSRHHRLFPGQGSFDLVTFTDAVLRAGYTGPLSLEVFNDVFRQSPPTLTAVDARRSLRDLTARMIETKSPLERQGQHTRPGEQGTEDRLPAAPTPGSCAFVEIEASPSSALGLRRVLGAMGFEHIADHRSKPVELWEQGSARVLVNTSAGADSAEPHTRVAAVGLETKDPDSAAARAHALNAERLPRVLGEEETPMPAVLIPDGTGLFFCPIREDDGRQDSGGGRNHDPIRDSGAASWLDDFVALETSPCTADPGAAGAAGGGAAETDDVGGARPLDARPFDAVALTVDHVSLTQPFDRFDESILLLRSLLDLPAPESAEHAGPYGLVRSQEFEPDSGLGFVLNASVLRRGSWSPGVVSPQHIALSTDDAFAAAEALAEAGAPVLGISPNHYADLQARHGLDDAFVAALASRGLLYERDARGGECLHLFTQVIGSQVFFEIIERRGGYTGFATADTPTRMAAHAAQRRRLTRPESL